MKKITNVVDNTVRQGSRFWGEHGLAFSIELKQDQALFDTGQSGDVLVHNLTLLGKSPQNIDALILSHAHNDHTGGLSAVLTQKPNLPLYASPDLFRPRFTRQDDHYKSIGLAQTREEVGQMADLHLHAAPVEVLPSLWTTGEITERPEPEGRSPHHFLPHGDTWQPDPYRDDMTLVLETQTGLVVICGCCHAGLLNTLTHIQRMFQQPIIAFLGGTHLVSADQAHLRRVNKAFRDQYGSPRLYLNHCTGPQAYVAMANAFGDRANPCPVGTTLMFD